MNQAELFALYPERRHPKQQPQAKLRLTRPEPAERDVLSSILQALNFCKRVAWYARINCAAGKLIYPDGSTSQFMRFGFPGCSDIIGQTVDGRFLAIETKRPSGRATNAQAAFLQTVRSHGGIAFTARSVSDLALHLGEKRAG